MKAVSQTGQTEFYLKSVANYQAQMGFTQIFNQEFAKRQQEEEISSYALQMKLASHVYKKLGEKEKKTFDRKSVEKWQKGTIPDNLHQLVMIAHFFQKKQLDSLSLDEEVYASQVERLYIELNEKYLLSAKGRCLYIRKKRDLAFYLAWRFDKFDAFHLILEDIKKCMNSQKSSSLSTDYEEKNLHHCKTYEQALELIANHSDFYESVDSCIRKRLQDKLGPLDIVERNSSLRGNLGELNREFILEICAIREVPISQVEELLRFNHMQTFTKSPWKELEYLALVDWQSAKKRELMAERMKLKEPQISLEVEDYMRYHKIWKKNVTGKLRFCLSLGETLFELEAQGIYYNCYSVNYILDRLVSSVYRTSSEKLTKELLMKRLDKISEDVMKNTVYPEIHAKLQEKQRELKQLSKEFSQVAKNKRQQLQEEINELEKLSKQKFINHKKGVYVTEKTLILDQSMSKTPMYFSSTNYTQYLYVAIVYSVFTGHSFWGETMNGYSSYLKDLKEIAVTPEKKKAFMILLKIFRDVLDEKETKEIKELLKESLNVLIA